MSNRRTVRVALLLLSVALPRAHIGDVLSANPHGQWGGTVGASTLPIDSHRVTDLAIVQFALTRSSGWTYFSGDALTEPAMKNGGTTGRYLTLRANP